jgi:hypothetical protein
VLSYITIIAKLYTPSADLHTSYGRLPTPTPEWQQLSSRSGSNYSLHKMQLGGGMARISVPREASCFFFHPRLHPFTNWVVAEQEKLHIGDDKLQQLQGSGGTSKLSCNNYRA